MIAEFENRAGPLVKFVSAYSELYPDGDEGWNKKLSITYSVPSLGATKVVVSRGPDSKERELVIACADGAMDMARFLLRKSSPVE